MISRPGTARSIRTLKQVALVMPTLRLLHHDPTARDPRVESFQGRNLLADPRLDGR